MEFKTLEVVEFKADAASRTFSGYAATWEEDCYGDIIKPGAFLKTLTDRGPRVVNGRLKSDIKILWQHRHDMPLGLPAMLKEDEKGLYFQSAPLLETICAQEAMKCLESGVVDKASIGYTAMKTEQRSDENGDYQGRNILELKLYEFSPVTFPANMGAEVKGIDAILRDSLPLLTKENARLVLRAIEKAGDCPEWLKLFLQALAIKEPPTSEKPSGVPSEQHSEPAKPPTSKEEPQRSIDFDMHSLLQQTADVNAKLADMLARRTGGSGG